MQKYWIRYTSAGRTTILYPPSFLSFLSEVKLVANRSDAVLLAFGYNAVDLACTWVLAEGEKVNG